MEFKVGDMAFYCKVLGGKLLFEFVDKILFDILMNIIKIIVNIVIKIIKIIFIYLKKLLIMVMKKMFENPKKYVNKVDLFEEMFGEPSKKNITNKNMIMIILIIIIIIK